MMWKAHVAFGLGTWLIGSAALGHQPGVEIAAVMLGSLAPDADNPRSKLGRWLPGFSHFLYYLAGGHRGLTHSLLLAVPLFLVVWWLYGQHLESSQGWFAWQASTQDVRSTETGKLMLVSLAFSVGYLSHLVGDLITRQGLRLLWPLPFVVRVTPFRADSWLITSIAYGVMIQGVLLQLAFYLEKYDVDSWVASLGKMLSVFLT